jgi:hypothetical protein
LDWTQPALPRWWATSWTTPSRTRQRTVG